MFRRDFLKQLTATAAGRKIRRRGDTAFAYAGESSADPRAVAKLDRISISTWSLHRYFQASRRPDFSRPSALVTLPDFPELILNRYHARNLEFCAVHFDSTESSYLHKVSAALHRSHSAVVNVVLDIKECGPHGAFSDPDPQQRATAVEAVKHWVDIAHDLGAKSVRVDPGNADRGNMAPTAESYRSIAEYAEARGMSVIVENVHDFGTRRPEEIVELIKLVGLGHVGALPDFANFPDPTTRAKGLTMLFPYAQTVCHAKGQAFDARGVEQTFDFPQAMEIARNSGFKGIYSIEFNGPGDPYAGIQSTLNELLHYM